MLACESLLVRSWQEVEEVKLLTAPEVAAILNVPIARVYELVRTKTLPSVHLGSRQLRFDETRLNEWIERGGCSAPNTNWEAHERQTDQ